MTINLQITAAAISRAMSFDSLLIAKGKKSTVVSASSDKNTCESLAWHYARWGFTLVMEPSEAHKAYHSITGTW
jgi:hypothetical protein